jgi:hypothetical protein
MNFSYIAFLHFFDNRIYTRGKEKKREATGNLRSG